ncbi:unnamed protein product [Clavelina lepadiformis]|uniref:4-coumarate--CoA ligase n=1 Tax=Clavelina lepadiformis TaxID=159417 RepID=A0ABP0F4X6_CLALP
MVLKSPMPDIVLPGHSFHEYMLRRLQAHGDEIALIACENGDTITFNQIRENALKCACAFNSLGIKKGDIIATCCSNSFAFSYVLIGASICGAVITTCNPNYTKEEMGSQFADSQPRIILIDGKNHQKIKDISLNVKSIMRIISVDESTECGTIADLMEKATFADYPHDTVVESDDTLLLPYSSGTTGLPKGIMLTHQNVVALNEISRMTFGIWQTDSLYLVLPTFHIAGILSITLSLSMGTKVVMEKRFSLESLFRNIEKHKITLLVSVPPMVLAIFNSPLLSSYDISSLSRIICGAAPLADGVAVEVQKRLNVRLYQLWGMSEAVPLTSSGLDVNIPIRSVGVVTPNTMLKVVNPETDMELGPNEEGELCGKGPQVMKGYFNNRTATSNCIDSEGWLHTGDIGYYDKYGCVYIIDRLKELIKYKGFQVAPAELEEVLLRHPQISDVAVIGISDAQAGEVPKAFVVKNDKSLAAEDIHKYLEGKVSSYKYLRGGVTFLDVIPKSPSGKIVRRYLRDQEKKKLSNRN